MTTHHQQPEQLHVFHRMHSALHIILMVTAVVVLAVLMSILRPESLSAGATDNVTGWAWSGVAGGGWISLNCTNDATCSTLDYGVNLDENNGSWSGSGWSSNVGWIDFANSSCGSGPVTNMTTGVTTGFAKVRAGGTGGFTGCINMAGNGPSASGGVMVNVNPASPNYGQMSGFAWSGDDVVANTNNTPANEWTTNGIADVGLGWIDFSKGMVDLDPEEDAEVVLFVDGQCNAPVEFSWTVTGVDESTCELYYVISTDPNTPIFVPNFNVASSPLTQTITGPMDTNLKFGMSCNNIITGDAVYSSPSQLQCASDPVFACSDNEDNDGDGMTDINDPQCHTDCDASNLNSWNQLDDNEGGTCLDPENNPNSPLNQTDGQAPIYIES